MYGNNGQHTLEMQLKEGGQGVVRCVDLVRKVGSPNTGFCWWIVKIAPAQSPNPPCKTARTPRLHTAHVLDRFH